jgi:hypothetical protein
MRGNFSLEPFDLSEEFSTSALHLFEDIMGDDIETVDETNKRTTTRKRSYRKQISITSPAENTFTTDEHSMALNYHDHHHDIIKRSEQSASAARNKEENERHGGINDETKQPALSLRNISDVPQRYDARHTRTGQRGTGILSDVVEENLYSKPERIIGDDTSWEPLPFGGTRPDSPWNLPPGRRLSSQSMPLPRSRSQQTSISHQQSHSHMKDSITGEDHNPPLNLTTKQQHPLFRSFTASDCDSSRPMPTGLALLPQWSWPLQNHPIEQQQHDVLLDEGNRQHGSVVHNMIGLIASHSQIPARTPTNLQGHQPAPSNSHDYADYSGVSKSPNSSIETHLRGSNSTMKSPHQTVGGMKTLDHPTETSGIRLEQTEQSSCTTGKTDAASPTNPPSLQRLSETDAGSGSAVHQEFGDGTTIRSASDDEVMRPRLVKKLKNGTFIIPSPQTIVSSISGTPQRYTLTYAVVQLPPRPSSSLPKGTIPQQRRITPHHDDEAAATEDADAGSSKSSSCSSSASASNTHKNNKIDSITAHMLYMPGRRK